MSRAISTSGPLPEVLLWDFSRLSFGERRRVNEIGGRDDSGNVGYHQPALRRIGLSAGFFISRFSETYAGAAAVLVDEIDPGGFERALDYLQGRVSWRARAGFQLMDGDDTNTCFTG